MRSDALRTAWNGVEGSEMYSGKRYCEKEERLLALGTLGRVEMDR